MAGQTFTKAERLSSKMQIDKLFGGGNATLAAFPLRAVYSVRSAEERDDVPSCLLISVPKKRLRLAVDRNRMKRQVREAYRKNKQVLWDELNQRNQHLDLALICISDTLCTSQRVGRSVQKILQRIVENLNAGE